MKILVTGGAGFIGSWLVERLLANGDTVTVVDNLSAQIHGAVPKLDVPWINEIGTNPALKFIRGDIRDLTIMDEVLAQVDAVVHLAAETGTGQSMYQIAHYYAVNQQGTAQIFELIANKHKHIKKIVLASSRSVYGEGAYAFPDGRVTVAQPRDVQRMKSGHFEPQGPGGETLQLVATPEDITPCPASVYAATKLANETLGRIFSDAYGVAVMALRFQNVYGERQSLKNPYTGILSIFSNRMRQNLPINIFEDGQESRDFVHVSDVVDAVVKSLHPDVKGFDIVNVGSGEPTTVMEMALKLRAELGSQSELTVTGDFRVGDIRHCYADLGKAQKVLDFSPKIDLTTGLRRFCAWVVTQQVQEDRSAQAQKELTQIGLGKASS